MRPRLISWYSVFVDSLYFVILWWVIPTHPAVIISVLTFLLFSQSWLLISRNVPIEEAYNLLKHKYTTIWFLGWGFVLRWIAVIPFFFYGEYIMALFQFLVAGTFWWLYQKAITSGKRMGLR